MYAIAFDFEIAALKEHYGEPYNNAYFEIGRELNAYGFERTQGSVYLSADGNMANLYQAINRLSAIDWVKKSVRDIRAFKVEDWSDFTEIVKGS